MKVRFFVSGSAAFLTVWLGATYLHEIPAKDYPELGRQGPKTAAVPRPAEHPAVMAALDAPPAAETAAE